MQSDQSGGNGQTDDSSEHVTKRFTATVAVIGVLVLIGLAALIVYITASSQLNQNYSYVSAGYGTLPDSDSAIAEGARQVSTHGCHDCHGQDLGGGVALKSWKGRFFAPNLTPGRGSAVAEFYLDDWVKAIRHGISRSGKPLLIMPSRDYFSISDTDLLQMIAYIRQVPPVDKSWPRNKPTAGTYLAISLGRFPAIAANVIDHSAKSVGGVKADTTVAYGSYLAQGCVGCHGAAFKGMVGPDLTETGALKNWSYDDFRTALTHGTLPGGKALSSAMPWKSFSAFNDTEVKALYKFLKSLR